MSNTKGQSFEVKEFKFGQLVPSQSANSEQISNYELRSLDDIANFKQSISASVVRQEREAEAATGFKVDPVIREVRGLKEQEEADFEQRISEEVERRVAAIQEQAFQQGYQAGEQKGHDQAYAESAEKYNDIVAEFTGKIAALNDSIRNIYEQSQQEAFLMVKNLTKWIILKEVDEKYYLVRLLQKLIYEINTKSNLVVRVNEQAFGYMPEVIKIVEREMGKLPNVRVEVDLDQTHNGIILESENTIVDGSLETQFKSIDKIFENAGINE